MKISIKCINTILILFILVTAGFSKKPEVTNLPDIFKKDQFLAYSQTVLKGDTALELINSQGMYNIQHSDSITAFKAIGLAEKDSLELRFTVLVFKEILAAFEYFCRYFIPDEASLELGWSTILLNDSVAISWYQKTLYLIHHPKNQEMDQEKLLKNIIVPRKKFKNIPNFIRVLPEDNQIPNSLRISLKSWLQFQYLNPVFYADYENKGRISRIFIIPEPVDSVLVQFQQFRNFYHNNGLLVNETLSIDLNYFIAQDIFLGRMLCILYRNYIIGLMNYPSEEWAKDRLNEIKSSLKKYPIHL